VTQALSRPARPVRHKARWPTVDLNTACAERDALSSATCVRSTPRAVRDSYVANCQQYLANNPFGYRCHANTGVKFPEAA
jgi:hypothetical protein